VESRSFKRPLKVGSKMRSKSLAIKVAQFWIQKIKFHLKDTTKKDLLLLKQELQKQLEEVENELR